MLGGSMQQVPAIKKAKELGLRTVLIDYLPDNPGQFEADKWYQESTTDVEAVYRIAKAEQVTGILAYASDPAALPAAIVSERLGLPTNPANSVEILGVKHKFRSFLLENGFACPKAVAISSEQNLSETLSQIEPLTFPIVVKPTDSSGSKGVSFLNDTTALQEAIDYAKQYSRNKILIIEEYIQRGYPHIIGGDIFVVDGKIAMFGDMECLRDNEGKGLIPIGEKKPNHLNSNQKDQLYTELQRLITSLNIRNGELNIEAIIDTNDNPHFLEVGPRAGGNMIPIQLSDAFGIDLIEANIKAAIGENISLKPIEPNECYMHYVLHSYNDGAFDHIVFSERISSYIYRKVIYKQKGDPVERFDGAGKAIGIIFFKFPSPKEMEDFCKNHNEYISIVLA